jgi:alpha-L-fucosidase
VVAGSFQDTKRADFTARDVRFTTKGDTLYAIVLGWPESGEVMIESLATKRGLFPSAVQKVELLDGQGALEWSHTEDGLHVKLPAQAPLEPAFVLRIV